MGTNPYPLSAICYILDDVPGVGEFQATGVIIGPHTILTASHVLWNADVGRAVDQISVYPGYRPGASNHNPPGALRGAQSIHYFPVPDYGGVLSADGTQRDYAVINTSADLRRFGRLALDPTFSGGDVVAVGYPAKEKGNAAGLEGVVSVSPTYSDLLTGALAISPGYSGAALQDHVRRPGGVVPAVTGVVSTGRYASKLTPGKVGQIRRWIAADSGLWTGAGAPGGTLVPQIPGTAAAATLAAALGTGAAGCDPADPATSIPASLVTLAAALHGTEGGAGHVPASPTPGGDALTLAAPVEHRHRAAPWHPAATAAPFAAPGRFDGA